MSKSVIHSKTDLLCSLKILFILILGILVVNKHPIWTDVISGGWEVCIEYINEGSLYGGQPYCNQAPLIYYYGVAIKSIMGYRFLWLGFTLTKLFLLVIVFQLINKFTIHLGYGNSFINSVLFLYLIYPHAANKPEVLFSTVFFLLGFYVQYHKRFERWEFVSGILYAISLFFKYTAIYPIGLGLIIQFHRNFKNSISNAILEVIKIISPTIVLTIIFYILHPLFWVYSVIGQIAYPASTLIDALHIQFFSWNIRSITLDALVVTYAYLLYNTRFKENERLYILYPLVCIPLVSLSMTRAYNAFISPEYYALHTYPLLIVSTQVLLKRRPKFFVLIVGFVLLYPSFSGAGLLVMERDSYLSTEIKGLDELVMSGLRVLPPPHKSLLFESDREIIQYIEKNGPNSYFSRFGWKVFDGQNRYIYSDAEFTGAEDPYWAPRLRKLTNITLNYSIAREELSKSEREVKEEIIGGKYDVIMYTAASWLATTHILSDIPHTELNKYCEMYVPDFKHQGYGRGYSTIIYTNKSVCAQAAREMAEYYMERFNEICNKSQRASRVVKDTVMKNGFLMNIGCNSNTEVKGEDILRPRLMDFIISALLLLLLNSLLNRQQPRKR